ncbi:MAG: hypothetical protein B6244_00540 [Candidatus Cloacimonetes bacterium 4572_55]|nr:MAG: hypothetical protein B6244_00540 [Candidatus Cloacimonetes bacterium 4572_55]
MREKHSDIIYKTKIKDDDGFLYILFEHQSRPDPLMSFRLLSYMVNIWNVHLDQIAKDKKKKRSERVRGEIKKEKSR